MSNIKPWRERTNQNVTGAMQAEITDLRTLIASMEAQEPAGWFSYDESKECWRQVSDQYRTLGGVDCIPLFTHPAQPASEPLISRLRKYADEWESLEEAGIKAQIDIAAAADLLAAQPASESKQRKLIGWRTRDYMMETADPAVAKNWEVHNEMLPIFEGDANTKLQPASEPIPLGFTVKHLSDWGALTPEANTKYRWTVERNEAPFCSKAGKRLWNGPTLQEAINEAMFDLGMSIAGSKA